MRAACNVKDLCLANNARSHICCVSVRVTPAAAELFKCFYCALIRKITIFLLNLNLRLLTFSERIRIEP